MNAATLIGELLPQAVTVAVSPLPIIAVILVLLAPHAGRVAVAFLGGWVLGVSAVVVVMTVLGSVIPVVDPDRSKPLVGIVKIVLGVLLLVLAVRQTRRRRTARDDDAPPPWMHAIERATPSGAARIAVLLSAFNPKNLLLGATAGVTIGTSGAGIGTQVSGVVVFVVIASLSIAGPVIAAVVLGSRAHQTLEDLRGWLTEHTSAIVTTVFLVSGTMTIGNGIGSF